MIGTTLNGRFRLDRELGRGGMGAVYRAIDSVLERPVAIKVLTNITGDELSRRIRLEAQILARLMHENVVRLYDFSADGEVYYFIMEEVNGPSFARRLKKIDLISRLAILIQTARALDYAHHQGVIHRDVKPANVLLTSTDQAKLSDFGLSMLADGAQESGVVRGTPHYMSPEQARGRKLNHRTDLYSLGVMLYECAAGSPPFSGPVMSVMSQQIHADPDPVRERNPLITEEFEALILGLMSKDPHDRPASGGEVAARLIALIDSGKIATDVASPTPVVPRTGTPLTLDGGNRTQSEPGNGSISPPMIASLDGDLSTRGIDPTRNTLGKPAAITSEQDALVQRIVAAVHDEPIALNAEERYLSGHYLAYLLGGSRRRGFLLRRPLDGINSDRARLFLAMTALTLSDGEAIDVDAAARLLESRAEVRTLMTPVVVAKYLLARSSPARRKRFRQVRQQLAEASEYATNHMMDERGILNPGLMPQVLDDLKRLAPKRTELDDQLADRWNELTQIWRSKPDFRTAVLRYATKTPWKDQASINLWPEVVYPLIERAQMQRQLRSHSEAFWDTIFGAVLRVGDAGVNMDRAIRQQVPQRLVREIELSLPNLQNDEVIEANPDSGEGSNDAEPRITGVEVSSRSFHDVEVDAPTRSFVRLARIEPYRQTVGELRELGREAIAALRVGAAANPTQNVIAIGRYRLVAVASVRARSAGQIAIQGMPNKQVELLVPPFMSGGPPGKFLVATWLYQNNSLAITYYDNLNDQRFMIWDAGVAQQTNLDDLASFHHHLYTIGLEVPDQVDQALSKSYRPAAGKA